MGDVAKTNQRDASAAIGGSLETMHEAIIAIFNNHDGVNTTTISPQPQSTRAIKYNTSDDRANKKKKTAYLHFINSIFRVRLLLVLPGSIDLHGLQTHPAGS